MQNQVLIDYKDIERVYLYKISERKDIKFHKEYKETTGFFHYTHHKNVCVQYKSICSGEFVSKYLMIVDGVVFNKARVIVCTKEPNSVNKYFDSDEDAIEYFIKIKRNLPTSFNEYFFD